MTSGGDLVMMSRAELIQQLLATEATVRAALVRQVEVIGEIRNQGLWAEDGYKNLPDFLRDLLRISHGEASGRVSVAANVEPVRNLTGQRAEPLLPVTTVAYREGAITNAHVRSIARTIASLPREVAQVDGVVEDLEVALVAVARRYDPATAARLFGQVRAHFDAQGLYDEAEQRERGRGLTIRPNPDGSSEVRGSLTARCTEALRAVLDSLARPQPATTNTGTDGCVDGEAATATDTTATTATATATATAVAGDTDADGAAERVRDPRSGAQRRHDALQEMCERFLAAGLPAASGGCRTTVLLTMDVDDFATDTGVALTGHGVAIPVALAKRWLEPEARAILVLLSKTKGILAYSSVSRLFSEQQRLAMAARDGGCTFPGCDLPVTMTEAHHIHPYAHGGETSVGNGALLCGGNHDTFEKAGWHSTTWHGQPCWVPPDHVDPTRTPRRNTLHMRQ